VISSCFGFRGPRKQGSDGRLEFLSINISTTSKALGARVEVVPAPDHIRIDLDKLLAAIDETTLWCRFRKFFSGARASSTRAPL